MSSRLDKSWRVLASPSTPSVDIFVRPDGSYGFEEFRRDPEDGAVWTPVASFCGQVFDSQSLAVAEARRLVPWLAAVLDTPGG